MYICINAAILPTHDFDATASKKAKRKWWGGGATRKVPNYDATSRACASKAIDTPFPHLYHAPCMPKNFPQRLKFGKISP